MEIALTLGEPDGVYALNLRGFGKSGKPAHVPGVPGPSEALDCWMRKLG